MIKLIQRFGTRALGLFLMLAAFSCLQAQEDTRATVGGRVTDPSAAAIVGAKVTVSSVETGAQVSTSTGKTGDWRVQFLPPGHYAFRVEAPGFKVLVHEPFELQVADQKFVDAQLEVGQTSETITVTAATPLIDTTAAVSGMVVEEQQLQDTPDQSHVPTMLAGLTTGAVVSPPTGASTAHLWSNISASNFSVNGDGNATGQGYNGINYTVDGGNDRMSNGEVAFIPPMDAIQEFRVTTNAYDASIGETGTATLNMQMKTGSKDLHGTLYEYNQNNFLNANTYNAWRTNAKIPPVHVNEWGAAVGGPVWLPHLLNGRKKKTFFFYSYDGIRNTAPATQGTMSLPTMAERSGDFSSSFTTTTTNGIKTTYPYAIYNPTTWNYDGKGDRQQFTNNIVTNPSTIGIAILKLLPPPDNAGDGANSDSNDYIKREVQNDKFYSMALRVDQSWNDRNRSYITLMKNTFNELSYDPFGPNNPLQGIYQKRLNRGMILDHSLVLKPTRLLDLRYTVTDAYQPGYDAGAGYNPTAVGFSSAYAALMHTPSLPLMTGLVSGAEDGGLGTNNGGNLFNDVFQTILASVTDSHGAHTLRYGGEYRILQEGDYSPGQVAGNFAFGTNWTTQNPDATSFTGDGNDIATLLTGLATSGSFPLNASAFWSGRFAAAYFQDDWRVNTKLTINLGLRWDVVDPNTERYNRLFARFDPNAVIPTVSAAAQANYQSNDLGTAAGSNLGLQLLQAQRSDASSFVSRGVIEYAGVNGTPNTIYNTKHHYFQPRVGFAYSFHPETVLRGGFGRFVQTSFDTGSQTGFSQTTNMSPTPDNYHTITATLANPYPSGLIQPTGNALGILSNPGTVSSFTDPNLGRAYVDEASLHLQQQFKSWLIDIGGTLELSRNYAEGNHVNMPTDTQYLAAYNPVFQSSGEPVSTEPGDTQVSNPYYQVAYITSGAQKNTTTGAYGLLRPNPILGDLTETKSNGHLNYYALNNSVQHRWSNGFSLMHAFTWSRETSMTGHYLVKLPSSYLKTLRTLSTNDIRFTESVSPIYQLPLGRGARYFNHTNRAVDELIGGWELSGVYAFHSGTPLSLPTNSSFYAGGDPGANAARGKAGAWFDTTKFVPFPSRSTPASQVQSTSYYPTWTGIQNLAGYNYVQTSSSDATKNGVYQDFNIWQSYNNTVYGDVRNPWLNNFDLGLRKNFKIISDKRLQLRMDAFNAFNHPRFGSIDTTPGDTYFGRLSGSSTLTPVNAPRAIELAGKIYF